MNYMLVVNKITFVVDFGAIRWNAMSFGHPITGTI